MVSSKGKSTVTAGLTVVEEHLRWSLLGSPSAVTVATSGGVFREEGLDGYDAG